MKRSLALILLLAFGSLPLTVAPARAQETASADDAIRKIKLDYEKMLSIVRNPRTSDEVREMSRAFLKERRAQLGLLLKGKLEALRTYGIEAGPILTAREKLQVARRIRSLEAELQSLQAETPTAVAEEAAPPQQQQPAPTQDPAPAPAPGATPEPKPTPIVFTNPTASKTVKVREYQIEVDVPDQKIKSLMLSVYRPGVEEPLSRPLLLERGDTGATEVVTLVRGANRIVVEDKSTLGETDAAKKKMAEVTLTYEPPANRPLGLTGGARSVTLTGTPTDKFTNVPDVGENVRVGYVGEAGKTYQFFVTKKDGTRQDAGSPSAPGLNGTVTAVFPRLEPGDQVGVVQIENGAPVDDTFDSIAVESPIDTTKGFPVGFLLGGAVLSQQAQEFGQSDPFFGFIAGYNFKVKNAYVQKRCGEQVYREMEDDSLADERGFTVRCDENTKQLLYRRASDNKFVARADDVAFVKSTSRPKKNGGFFARRMNLRFQGLFQSDPRRAEATETATTDDGTTPPPDDPFKFIASRKTFDVEMHGWIDFWANNMFTLGPYAAIGASTVLDKNELQGEAVTAQAQTGEGSSPDTDTVATAARSDNDIKKYYEFGVLSNTQLFNRSLFIQTILAYGNYEALSGLYDGDCALCDTKHRFIGKLRIFPSGLSREFGRQIQAAPMFGVDLNAGRGPDHLKFFTGFAVRIRSINAN